MLTAAVGTLVVSTVGFASVPTTEPADDTAAEPVTVIETSINLADVCPDPFVIQTDWFPESEYGATYNLLGDEYTIDADNKIVSGPMVAGGQPTGIDVEIRAGGPAIGSGDVETEMYLDDGIALGYATTDGQVKAFAVTPLLSVVAPLEENPQMIMWDPDTYPDVETIADLGTAGVIINVFGGQTFTDVFVGAGLLQESQVDPSYDASPRAFIAEEGRLAQQGFASAEPYAYEHIYTEWGRPVAFQTIHDAGFQVYSQTLAVRPDRLEELRPCLEQIVPIVQQSAVDFLADPTAANALIVDVVLAYDTFWTYPPEIAEFSVEMQKQLGLVGNGPDDTLGNFELERVEAVIEQMRAAGLEIPEGLVATDLFTNEFIDPTIGAASFL